MKLEGKCLLSAGPDQVWVALNDPRVLAQATPGCKEFSQVGPDEYAAVLELGVAGVKGRYTGKVSIADREPPSRYRLLMEGSGTPGFIKAELLVVVRPNDGAGTELSFVGDAQVGGVVAGVGQRMLSGIAKLLMDQFFKGVEKATLNVQA
jgi:carbon monoxide dehydrogenase subunit G